MTTDRRVAMDGFSKVRPLTEGYIVKGGVNTTSRITTRPPAPQPMRPSPSAATSVPEPSKPARKL
jgi:hypothetical protein